MPCLLPTDIPASEGQQDSGIISTRRLLPGLVATEGLPSNYFSVALNLGLLEAKLNGKVEVATALRLTCKLEQLTQI